MEDKKDFDKDKQEMGTQQMPYIPTDGEEDGKKGTIVLFGHEFDKKKAVMAGLGGLLAIALIGGGAWYAMNTRQPQDKPPVEQVEKQEQQVIQLGAKADGWVKGESSPVIAHIVNKEEKVDYYHAYDANEPHALDVPAKGEYEVSFISPVDKDGSTYEVPKAAKVKAESEDANGKDAGDELPFEFKPIAADKADADALNTIVKSVGDAVKKGDETLTGANGTKVIELVKENAKANPNADAEKVEEESKKAEEGVSEKPTGETGAPSSKPSGGNSQGTTSTGGGNAGDANSGGQSQGGSNNGNSGSSSGGGNSGSSGNNSGSNTDGGESKPQHTHNWVAQTTTVHHDAEYKTVHHEAVTKGVCVCNGCGAQFDTDDDWGVHSKNHFFDGCQSYHTSKVVIQQAWDEQVLVSAAWDETVTTGYVCSGCGAAK